jgi:hypothetical protein
MNKSKRQNETIKKRSKNKTSKNNSRLGSCEKFCKNDYLIKKAKKVKIYMDKYFPGHKSSKEAKQLEYVQCKKFYCNENCNNILNDQKKQLEYKKTVNNGFHKSYPKAKIENLKSRGAISGCNIATSEYD